MLTNTIPDKVIYIRGGPKSKPLANYQNIV